MRLVGHGSPAQLRTDDGQRLGPDRVGVAFVNRLEIGRRLEPRSGEVVLARDFLHERLPGGPQQLDRDRLHPATRPATISRTRSDDTRSWASVSRSRIVTVLSAIVCPSTVM